MIYPTHYLDNLEINLGIYSKEEGTLADNLHNKEINQIALKLEETYSKKEQEKEIEGLKRKNIKLAELEKLLKYI
jgi:hypothetical protein